MPEEPTPLVYSEPFRRTSKVTVPIDQPYPQPYWLSTPGTGNAYVVENRELIGLAETPAVLRTRFRIRVGGVAITLRRPVVRRYVDRVEGETSRPLVVAPAVAVSIPEQALIFPDGKSKAVEVLVRGSVAGVEGDLSLTVPAGWAVQPASAPFRIAEADEQMTLSFSITPPRSTIGTLRATARVAGRDLSSDMHVIAYNGYPIQTVFPPSQARLVRADIRTLAKKIGYVMGRAMKSRVRFGKGACVFAAYPWFRQLPAGVPGAFCILADFMSAGKAVAPPSR